MIGADSWITNSDVKNSVASSHATQRYLRGYSDADMWNFDCFLADVIVAGCEWHIENSITNPWKIIQDDWTAILSEIRDGFSRRDSEGMCNPPKRAWKLLRDNFQYFWD